MKKLLLIAVLGLIGSLNAQTDSTQTFDLDLEFRPRAEFRYGYKTLVPDNAEPAFFISNRIRIGASYQRTNFRFHASIQDVRTLGTEGLVDNGSSLGLFEGYFEIDFSKKWMLKFGRQAVELDNGRLFAESNWSQSAKAHDGAAIFYQSKKVKNSLYGFYNQSQENYFGSEYDLSASTYKGLFIDFFEFDPNEKWSFNLMNVVDGWDSQSVSNTTYLRGTSGGKIQYSGKQFSALIRAYYQYGQLRTGQEINAYYAQPELRWDFKGNQIRLGAEYVSGENTSYSESSRAFVPLYGVAFRFMGNLNYFTRFPSDVNYGGLFNPYLSLRHKFKKNWRLQSDVHAFILPEDIYGFAGMTSAGYLGTELDIKARFKLNSFTTLDAGVAGMIPTQKMESIKFGNSNHLPFWSFVMVTFKPNLLHIKQSIEIIPKKEPKSQEPATLPCG